jgi:hypothetical protein
VVLIVLGYSFGDGNFLPLMGCVVGHVLLMTLMFYVVLLHGSENKNNVSLANSLFNGLANIYLSSWLKKVESSNKTVKKRNSSFTLIREFSINLIFILEHIIILIITGCNENEKLLIICGIAVGVHFMGLCLKLIYYRCCHIWKDLLWTDLVDGLTNKKKKTFREESFNNYENNCDVYENNAVE